MKEILFKVLDTNQSNLQHLPSPSPSTSSLRQSTVWSELVMSSLGIRRGLLRHLSSDSRRSMPDVHQPCYVAGFSTWRRSSVDSIQFPSELDSTPGGRAMSLHATHACLSGNAFASERKRLVDADNTPCSINKSSLETLAAGKDSKSTGGALTWAEQFLIKRKRLVDLP